MTHVAELVRRYSRLSDGVEYDNEVLIFQIYDADVQYWKDVYKAVKAVAPDMPVHLTTHTNTGAFDRLNALGVPYDRIGAHAYMDSLDAIQSGRNYALAMSDYGSEIGKPPIITMDDGTFVRAERIERETKLQGPTVLQFGNVQVMFIPRRGSGRRRSGCRTWWR